jgi:hypothetical protein
MVVGFLEILLANDQEVNNRNFLNKKPESLSKDI